tara:strand:- start:341 stop:556 length:216 start_codon:yes stop_codon:yes gene_type:complete
MSDPETCSKSDPEMFSKFEIRNIFKVQFRNVSVSDFDGDLKSKRKSADSLNDDNGDSAVFVIEFGINRNVQ